MKPLVWGFGERAVVTAYYYVLRDGGVRWNAVTEMSLLLAARLVVAGAGTFYAASFVAPHRHNAPFAHGGV